MVAGEAIGSRGDDRAACGSDLRSIRPVRCGMARLRDQWAEGIHFERPAMRCGGAGKKTDTLPAAKALRFSWSTQTSGIQARQDLGSRLMKAGYVGALLRELRCRRTACWAVKAKLYFDDDQAAQERLAQAHPVGHGGEHLIDLTVEYTSQRKAFGQTIGDFPEHAIKLAEMKTDAVVVAYLPITALPIYDRSIGRGRCGHGKSGFPICIAGCGRMSAAVWRLGYMWEYR